MIFDAPLIELFKLLVIFLLAGGGQQGVRLEASSFAYIDVPGATDTYAAGINQSGQIVGTFKDANGHYHGFVKDGGAFITIDAPGCEDTYATAINQSGHVVGTCPNPQNSSIWTGFIKIGNAFTTIEAPRTADTRKVFASGINQSGQVVGTLALGGGKHGFIRSGDGNLTLLDVPWTQRNTYMGGINESGTAVGAFRDDNRRYHGFLMQGGSFTEINIPAALDTYIGGINQSGQIVGAFRNSMSLFHGFLKDSNGFTFVDVPDAMMTAAIGINDSGQVVGSYIDLTLHAHGFVTTPQPSTKPILISPSGTIQTSQPTYSWFAVPSSTWYYLWVNDSSSSTGKIKEWYTAEQAGCASGAGVCSVAPSTALATGRCTWWIQTWINNSAGPWSDGKDFSVSLSAPPGKAILISPSGNIQSNLTTYTWNAVAGSTWYQLWVSDSTASPKILNWYKAVDAGCASGVGTCSVTPASRVAPGQAQWWIQTWNSAGYGPWSDGMTFTVSGSGVPGKATLISPSGSIATTTPTYVWNAVSNATWYQLWVDDSSSSAKIKAWLTSAQAGCASGTGNCSITVSTPLSPGACQWWIQTWNSIGYGPWSDPMSFTVGDSGVLDPSFGGTGIITTFFGGNTGGTGAALQADGKILVAGGAGNYPEHHFAVMRLNSNGSLDTTFAGGTGKVTTSFGLPSEGRAVVVQPDGKIVIAGVAGQYPAYDFALARYTSSGSLDTTFANGTGKTIISFGSPATRWVTVALALQIDGRIVVVGSVHNAGGDHDFALARFNSNGSPDTSFGDGTGKVTTNFGGDDLGMAIALQPDGKIVAAGTSLIGSYNFALARYNSNGSLDTTFGGGSGKVTSPFGVGTGVALQADGKIVVAGDASDFVLARYNSDGSLDAGFGGGSGKVVTDFGGGDGSEAVALQPDGRIVVSGHSYTSARIYIAVARYRSDGNLDTSFAGSTGKILTYIDPGNVPGQALVLQPDGKIVVAGANGLFAVVRYR